MLTAGVVGFAPVLGSGDSVSPPGDEGADGAPDGSADAGPAVALGEIVVQPPASDEPASTASIETTRAPRIATRDSAPQSTLRISHGTVNVGRAYVAARRSQPWQT